MRPRLEDPRHRRTSLAVSATVTGTISPAPGVPGRWHPQTVKRVIEARAREGEGKSAGSWIFYRSLCWFSLAGIRRCARRLPRLHGRALLDFYDHLRRHRLANRQLDQPANRQLITSLRPKTAEIFADRPPVFTIEEAIDGALI